MISKLNEREEVEKVNTNTIKQKKKKNKTHNLR